MSKKLDESVNAILIHSFNSHQLLSHLPPECILLLSYSIKVYSNFGHASIKSFLFFVFVYE